LASLRAGDAAIDEALLRGMARGWPKGRPAKLERRDAEAIKQLALGLPAPGRGQLVRLVTPWNDPILAAINADTAATLLKSAHDESLPESRRVDAARQLVELRSASDETARELLGLITPRTPPELAAGLIDAVASGQAPGAGAALVERLPALPPSPRAEAIRALLRRADW